MPNDPFDIDTTTKDQGLIDLLKDKCQMAVDLMEAIEGYEAATKAAKAQLQQLRTVDIPEAMTNAGVGSIFSLLSGEKIELSQFVMGSLPKEEGPRDLAFKALIQHGGESLIKTKISAAFPKGQSHAAEQAAQALKDLGVDVDVEPSVHPSSLQSFVRDALKKGEELPLETLGLSVGTVAKITMPKEKQ